MAADSAIHHLERGPVNAEKLPGQFDFLNRLRKERKVVSLYLVSGIRFLGRVVSFDREALLLDTKQGELLFAQRQISTIGPETGKPRMARPSGPGEGRHERPPRFERGERGDRGDRPERHERHERSFPPDYDVGHDAGHGAGHGMGRGGDVQLPMREPGYPAPKPATTVQIIRKGRRIVRPDSEES